MGAYFFEKGIAEQEYEGYIYPLSSREIREKVTLKITELEQFQSGELYALELEQLEVTDTEDMISMGRQYLGYFYVKDSQIYRLPVKDYSGFTEEQTQNTVKAIRNDEKSFELKSWALRIHFYNKIHASKVRLRYQIQQ